MTTEPTNPAAGSNWGDAAPAAQPDAKKSWSGRKTAVAVGVAVLIAGGGGVAIAVGTSGSNNANQAGLGPGQGGPNFGGMAGGIGALASALHGDFVVSNGNGGYTTERLQTGNVIAVSATSNSVTSKDGYAQVYTIDSSTEKNSDPKTGENVTVVAKISGNTATATTIGNAALQRGGGQGGPPNGLPGGQRRGGN